MKPYISTILIGVVLSIGSHVGVAMASVAAIAYCSDDGSVGVGKESNEAAASISAIQNCKSGCCQVMGLTDDEDKCIALAVSKEIAETGMGTSRAKASAGAIKQCTDDGSDDNSDASCKVIAAECVD